MRLTLFHDSDQARQILRAGFVDGDGAEGIGKRGLVGALPTAKPRASQGQETLAVTFPDGFSLDDYALSTGKHHAWEWCVPAVILNTTTEVRLLADVDVSSILARQDW